MMTREPFPLQGTRIGRADSWGKERGDADGLLIKGEPPYLFVPCPGGNFVIESTKRLWENPKVKGFC